MKCLMFNIYFSHASSLVMIVCAQFWFTTPIEADKNPWSELHQFFLPALQTLLPQKTPKQYIV